jgi:hypothetical protein
VSMTSLFKTIAVIAASIAAAETLPPLLAGASSWMVGWYVMISLLPIPVSVLAIETVSRLLSLKRPRADLDVDDNEEVAFLITTLRVRQFMQLREFIVSVGQEEEAFRGALYKTAQDVVSVNTWSYRNLRAFLNTNTFVFRSEQEDDRKMKLQRAVELAA